MDNKFDELFGYVLSGIEKLPSPFKEKAKEALVPMKELVADSRAPRIAIVGRRGAGKSSLINAIFRAKVADTSPVRSKTGASKWHSYAGEKGSIEILDTRGVGDHTRPEDSASDNFMDDLKPAIKDACPDVILFLCKAKEVDAHIDADLDRIHEIRAFIKKQHRYDIPLVAVVTQVDELDPKRANVTESDEKQAHVWQAQEVLTRALADRHLEANHVTAISAYGEFAVDGRLTYNEFWQVDQLVEFLCEDLPRSTLLQLARLCAVKNVQHTVADVLIKASMALCGGIAGSPLPGADIVPITAAQVAMVMGIGYVSGEPMSKELALRFMAAMGLNVGAGFVMREAARAIIKFVPVGGEAVSAAVTVAATWSLGKAAAVHFIDGRTLHQSEQVARAEPPQATVDEAMPA